MGEIFVKIGIKTQNISKKRLKFVAEIFLADLREKHKDSKTALEEWYFKTTKAEWQKFIRY